MTVATAADASALLAGKTKHEAAEVKCNPHKKPAPIPSRVELERLAIVRHEDALVEAPGEAPRFEWDALLAFHLRHSRDIRLDTGPGLGLGRRLDRLISPAERTYQLFASGQHRSGAPNLAI